MFCYLLNMGYEKKNGKNGKKKFKKGGKPCCACAHPRVKHYQFRPLWEIRIQTIEWDNTGSLYTSTPIQRESITTPQEDHHFIGLMWISWRNIVIVGLTIPFEYKKKNLPCANIIAFFTSFIDVQDIAWQTSPGS